MKRTFTLLVLIAASFSTIAQSGPGGGSGSGQVNGSNGNTNPFAFLGTPTIVAGSGLTPGAKYKFTSVLSNVTAYVTIVSATGGAVCTNLDDNTLTMPQAFSPVISVPAHSTGLVEFKFEFFQGNSNNPYTNDTLRATAMDIDGSGNIRERDVIDMGAGSIANYINPVVEINFIQTGTAWQGTNTAGIEYDGVDTAAKQVMFTVKKANVSTFTYKAGVVNTGNSTVSRQKGIYFKGFVYDPARLVLAVRFNSFTGALQNQNVNLNWSAEENADHDHYEIQRSNDGNTFGTIGIALDGFENGTAKTYAYKDNIANVKGRSTVWYRIKQFDKNGKVSYSNIIMIRLGEAAATEINVYPNPFVSHVNAQYYSEVNGKTELRIASVNGKNIASQSFKVIKGLNNLQMSVPQNISAGVYNLSIISNGKIIGSRQIVK